MTTSDAQILSLIQTAYPGFNSATRKSVGDTAIAAQISSTNLIPQSISTDTALEWAATGPMGPIVDASNNSNSPVRASCLAFIYKIQYGTNIDMELPSMQAMFTAWVTAGTITQAQHDALIAIATILVPVAQADVSRVLNNAGY